MKELEALEDKLCPSYICKSGASLYGIVNKNGLIDYLPDAIEINQAFVEEAKQGREPEKRFRFAGNCAKSGCNHWDGSQKECGLINKIIKIVDKEEVQTLQDCSIRSQCRWYGQKKGLACSQCNEIIRNIEIKLIESAN